jgi:hypothetical protein
VTWRMACSPHSGKKFRSIHVKRDWLLYSQQCDIRSYLVPQRSSSCPHPISWRYILILFFHVGLGFQSTLFIHVSQQNTIVCLFSIFVNEISVSWNVCYVDRWDCNMCWINTRIACVFISIFYLEKWESKFHRGIFKFLPDSTKPLSEFSTNWCTTG